MRRAGLRRSPLPRMSRGFTLLEVVLAFSLLAVGLGLLIGILSGGLRQVRVAGAVSEATLYAQSLLDTRGRAEVLEPGTDSGEFDDGRYRWELRISEFADPAFAGIDLLSALRLYRVELDVEWGKGGPDERVHFVTLRAVSPPQLPSATVVTRSSKRQKP